MSAGDYRLTGRIVTITATVDVEFTKSTLTRSQRKRLRNKKPVATPDWMHINTTSSERRAWKRSLKRKEMLAELDAEFAMALTAKYTRMRPTFRTIAA